MCVYIFRKKFTMRDNFQVVNHLDAITIDQRDLKGMNGYLMSCNIGQSWRFYWESLNLINFLARKAAINPRYSYTICYLPFFESFLLGGSRLLWSSDHAINSSKSSKRCPSFWFLPITFVRITEVFQFIIIQKILHRWDLIWVVILIKWL